VPESRSTAWRILKVVLFLVILLGIGRALLPDLRSMDWSRVRTWRPEVSRLIVSFVILFGVYLAHAFLWRRIVTDLGVGRPSPKSVVRIYFLSSLGRYIPGKFWQLAGLAALAGRAGISPGGAAAASLLGQFAFLATGLLFLAVQIPDFGRGAPLRFAGILLVLAAGLVWLVTETPAGRNGREWVRARLGRRIGEGLAAAFDLAERIRGRDAIMWGVGYGLTWIALGFAFSLFVTAFVPEATDVSRRLAGTVAASYLAGYLVLVAPAGLGVREGTMTGLLAAVPSIPFDAAVVVAILSRVWFTIAEIGPLALIPLMRDDPTPSGSASGSGSGAPANDGTGGGEGEA